MRRPVQGLANPCDHQKQVGQADGSALRREQGKAHRC